MEPIVVKDLVMAEQLCANCGSPLTADQQLCPHCGAAAPAEKQDRKQRLKELALGKPLSKTAAKFMLAIGLLIFGSMAGCGIYVGATGTDLFSGIGWIFAGLGLAVLGYIFFDAMRSFRK